MSPIVLLRAATAVRPPYPRVTPATAAATLRAFATAPCADPLEFLLKTSLKRNLCDASGYRLPGVHWTLSVAFASDDPMQPPNLRTVGIQRVSDLGIDFVVKQGSAQHSFQTGRPVSILAQTGRYKAGETAQQWRGDGHCDILPLEDVLDVVPGFTVTHMVAAKRMEQEDGTVSESESHRASVKTTSHLTEMVQQARSDQEDGSLTFEELNSAIRAFRFHPDRIECMTGSPDNVCWERWEWTRLSSGDCPEGTIPWDDARALLPH